MLSAVFDQLSSGFVFMYKQEFFVLFYFIILINTSSLSWARSVGADGLPCLMVAAIVWLWVVLEVLVHVHVVISIGGVTGQVQVSAHGSIACLAHTGFRLDAVHTLDDGDGRLGARWVAGAVRGQVRGRRGRGRHGDGARVNSYAALTAAQGNGWLRPESEGQTEEEKLLKTRKENCFRVYNHLLQQ